MLSSIKYSIIPRCENAVSFFNLLRITSFPVFDYGQEKITFIMDYVKTTATQ